MKLKFSILVFVICTLSSNQIVAQSLTLIPSITARMNYTAVSESNNVALIGGLEHYISTNAGASWTELNNNAGSGLYQMEGFGIAVQSSSVFCMIAKNTPSGIYCVLRTSDGGATWTSVLNVGSAAPFKDIEVKGTTFVVTAQNGIYRSPDSGVTWFFVSLSSGYEISNFVEYNNNASSWLIGGYTSNFQVSYDDGLSWQELNLGFSPSTIQATTPTANGVMISKSDGLGTQMILLGTSNTADTTTTISSGLVFQGTPCKNAAFMPDNKILTHNNNFFFIADTSNQQLYNIDAPAAGLYGFKGFSLGTTYGLAIGTNSGNTQSKAYLINLSGTSVLSVPSQYTVAGPGPCAGDNIVAIPNANYADSYKWYVNNVLVSTSNTLSYPTLPNGYGTYTIKLNTYYQGIMNSTTTSVVLTAPSPPGTYVATVDTSACYGLPLHVLVNPDGLPANTGIKILYNGELIYGPATLTGVNVNAYTDPLTVGGTLQIITYKTLYCDPSADTLTKQITVGPNLFDFDILPHDSVICVGVNPYLYINGTNSDYSYDFYTTYSTGTWQSVHNVLQGNSTGTMDALQMGSDSYLNDDTQPQTYGSIYMYVNLEITDNAGCSPSQVIDTIRIQRSTAFFELHSRSFLQNDTVNLSNAYVAPNRLWSSEELDPIYISNATDTIPLIIADTTGFFGIELKNEPLPGCVDSMVNYIHYAAPSPQMDTVCAIKKLHRNDFLQRAKMDQFGNLYEIWSHLFGSNIAPLYVLSKYDRFGNLLWEKRATDGTTSYYDVSGVVIEEIEFDDQGNPVIALWVSGENGYQGNLVSLPSSNSEISANYVLKLDKLTGDYIWRTNLSSIQNLNVNSRITDLVVDGDKIHSSVYNIDNTIHFFTLNCNDGSLLNHDFVETGGTSSNPYVSDEYQIPTGSTGNEHHSYWSPQLDVLSTGEVIAIGNYRQSVSQGQPLGGTFVMKYHPDLGVYDFDTIAVNAQNGNGRPTMFVDKNDNITIAGNWTHDVFYMPVPPLTQILDSVIPMPFGTFVLNMDKNYQMNWLNLGTYSDVQDMTYSRANDHTYIASFTKDNFSIGNTHTHIMSGIERPYNPSYTSLPHYFYPPLDLTANTHFITHLDEEGKPLEMKVINEQEGVNYAFPDMKLAASACGDLAIFWGNPGFWPTYPTYEGDSLFLLMQYSDCSEMLCSYIELPDTLNCYSGVTVELQLSDYFNLNSFTYNIVQNNNVIVSNQTATVTNGHFTIPVSSIVPPFQVVCTSPNTDTLFVGSSIIVQFGALTEDTVCVYDGSIAITGGSPAGGTYSGTGVGGTTFTPSIAGLGTHVLTYTYDSQQGCEGSDVATVFVDECLGIDESEMNISVYPNPFINDFQVICKGVSEGELILLDQTGRTVYRSVVSEGATNVKMNALSSGNYTVVIWDQNKQVYRDKLIKL